MLSWGHNILLSSKTTTKCLALISFKTLYDDLSYPKNVLLRVITNSSNTYSFIAINIIEIFYHTIDCFSIMIIFKNCWFSHLVGFLLTSCVCGAVFPIIRIGTAARPISTTRYWLSLGSVPILTKILNCEKVWSTKC